MENINHVKQDAYCLLERAQQIIGQAVGEARSLTIAETALVASLRAEAEPMLTRVREVEARLAQQAANQ
jgi:hypothetical protein